MKPQRFKPGQAVTPNAIYWDCDVPGYQFNNSDLPKFGEIYQVKFYTEYSGCNWYMLLEGMPMQYAYNESGFEPIVSDTVLAQELESITEKV